MKKQIISIALVLCMVLSVLPMVAFAQSESSGATTAKDITLGYSALHDGDTTNAEWDYVYFGTYNDSPIKWRVLSTKGSGTTVGRDTNTATYKTANGTTYTGDALFMLSENTLFDTWFYGTTYDNAWLTSNLRDKMQNIFSNGSNELKYVLKTTKTDSGETINYKNANNGDYPIPWGTSSLSDDTLFALSAREVEQYLGSTLSNRKSGNAAWWWLRSPGAGLTSYAGLVIIDGVVDFNFVDNIYGVRPALNLNLSSVLFTSAALGKTDYDSEANDDTTGFFKNKSISNIGGNDGYKLTLLDSSRSAFKAELNSFSNGVATVSYSGATTGTNEYISVIVKNGDTVKYYGRIAAVASENGGVNITLPEDFSTANGDVLCVFNEQYNGDYNTDYASELIDVLFDYTVKFDANGGAGTTASQTMTYGATANLSANTFTRTGYTFTGWNTKNDGTGTAYSDGQSVTNLVTDASAPSVTLYAQWEENSDYTVDFDTAGGTYISTKTHVKWTGKVLDGVSEPTRNGYKFTGWKCENVAVTADTAYADLAVSDTVMLITLSAQWEENSDYTVNFDTAGGTDVAEKTNVKWTGKVLDGVTNPTRAGYVFNGWKCGDEKVTANTKYSELVADDGVLSVTLTAQWKQGNANTLRLNGNGGLLNGSSTYSVYTNADYYKMFTDTEYGFVRDGYAFIGWNTESDGHGDYVAKGDYVRFTCAHNGEIIVLYAIWEKDETAPVISGVEDGKTYCAEREVTVTDNYGIASVTVNGDPITLDENGKFIRYGMSAEQTIVATDKAGNQTTVTVTINDGHTYEWQSEDGQYWQKCKFCDHETDKKDVPQFEIGGNDTVCQGHDWEFTFTLPEGSIDVAYGYEFENKGDSDLPPTYENGVYTIVISADIIANESRFKLSVYAKTPDGFEFTSTKEVAIISDHTGGTADCTHKAVCEICGDEYGEADAHNHIGEKRWNITTNRHEQFWDCCEETIVEAENHEWENGVCTECDYVCLHAGGTADCTHKAVCEICGEEYGEVDAHNHAALKHIEAKEATAEAEGNIEYWYCEDCDKYFGDKDGEIEITLADTVIAKLPKADDDSNATQTGDNDNMMLWIILLFASGGALAATAAYARKKKRFVK